MWNDIAKVLNNLGILASDHGEYSVARVFYEEGLAIQRKVGNSGEVALLLNNLGEAARGAGDYQRGRALLKESLLIVQDLENGLMIAAVLEGLAAVATALGETVHAARIWGRAARLREELGVQLPPLELAHHRSEAAVARTTMGDDAAFDLAWQEGRAMTLNRAVEVALSIGRPA